MRWLNSDGVLLALELTAVYLTAFLVGEYRAYRLQEES